MKKGAPAKAPFQWYVLRVCAKSVSHVPTDRQAEGADAVSES
jgi:hypothetical protein